MHNFSLLFQIASSDDGLHSLDLLADGIAQEGVWDVDTERFILEKTLWGKEQGLLPIVRDVPVGLYWDLVRCDLSLDEIMSVGTCPAMKVIDRCWHALAAKYVQGLILGVRAVETERVSYQRHHQPRSGAVAGIAIPQSWLMRQAEQRASGPLVRLPWWTCTRDARGRWQWCIPPGGSWQWCIPPGGSWQCSMRWWHAVHVLDLGDIPSEGCWQSSMRWWHAVHVLDLGDIPSAGCWRPRLR